MFAVLSDIHSNIEALTVVLDDIENFQRMQAQEVENTSGLDLSSLLITAERMAGWEELKNSGLLDKNK